MADYTDLPNTAVGVGGIPSGTTVTALRDNPIAIAERAVGAPKVVGADYELLSRTVISGTPAAIDFTFDQSLYDAIVFELGNVIPATDSALLYIRTTANSGVSWDSGASDYRYVSTSLSDISSSVFVQTSNGRSEIRLFGGAGTAAGEDGFSGQVTVFHPSLEKKTSVEYSLSLWSSVGIFIAGKGQGVRNSAAIVNGVRFLLSSGNFEDGGIITMYGVRNS